MPAPTMMNAPKTTRTAEIQRDVLKNGITSEVETGPTPDRNQRLACGKRDHRFRCEPDATSKALGSFCHFQISS